MKRSTITWMLACGTAAVVGWGAVPGKADAQIFSPCLIIGSPMPPPCITFDYKKLADVATQNAHELQKVEQTVNTIKQAKAATSGLLSDARNLADVKIDFRGLNADANQGPILTDATGSLGALAGRTGDKFFTNVNETTDQAQASQAVRQGTAEDANVEAFAYGVQEMDELQKSNDRLASLAKKACKSEDLRTDWAVNSDIKIELINQRARQAYLLSAYLRQSTAENALDMRSDNGQGYQAGTIAIEATPSVTLIDQSAKVSKLRDLYAEAQGLLGSLGVVQMSGSIQNTLRSVIADYHAATQAKQDKVNELLSYATSWARHSKHCSATSIVDTITSRLGTMNAQTSALSALPVSTLENDKVFSTRGIDAQAMLNNDVDPRQFIGTWADPLHAQNTMALAEELESKHGALASCIDGDSDNKEMRQLVAGYSTEDKSKSTSDPDRYVYHQGLNDLILQEAWKKQTSDDAEKQLAQSVQTISDENTSQGQTITEADVTNRLKAIVAQANQLGQEIGAGEDVGSKQNAGEILTDLQGLVNGGTSLPAVDVSSINGDVPSPGVPSTVPPTAPSTNPPTVPTTPSFEDGVQDGPRTPARQIPGGKMPVQEF